MASSNPNSNRLAELEERLKAFIDHNSEDDDDDDSKDDDARIEDLVAILQDACSLIRDADGNAPDFKTIVDRVDLLVNSAVDHAYNDGDLCDFMPSFSHSGECPELDGKIVQEEEVVSNHELNVLKSLMTIIKGELAGDSFDSKLGEQMLRGPEPWSTSMRPHPLTTRLSRFRSDVTIPARPDQPLANVIYEARCEITSNSIRAPIGLTISASGSVLVAHGMAGYKNRSPALWYYFPEETVADEHAVQLGLSDIAYWTTTDDERKLMFAADKDRIKSFAWGLPSGNKYRHGLPTHTLDSGSCEGPLAVLSGGRLVRAGKGSVALWNLDTLPTHGVKGKTRIGKKISVEDTSRDDPESIETSDGSPADTTITLELSDLSAGVWHPHPSIAGNMILAADPHNPSGSPCYSCVSVDLEHGGKTSAKYLGHGAGVNAIATSPGDPNMFVSGSDDGFARLFDVRHPLPVLTLKAGHPSGGCPAVVMVHPDGIPTVFTGADVNEHIKVWDIRARQAVYELATGNNAVAGMAWDAAHNSLYAITECRFMNRLGNNFDYRRAKIPSDQNDELDGGYEGRCWPKRAYHGEDYFGYLFDAGDHRIYRFTFKENPDSNVLPVYGQAMLESAHSYW